MTELVDIKEDIYGQLTISMSSAFQIGQHLQGIGADLFALSDEFKDLRTTLLECDDAFDSELTAVYQQLAELVKALGNAHQEMSLELKPFGALHDGDYLFVRETGERIPLDEYQDDISDDTWELAKRIKALPDDIKQQVLQMMDIKLD